MIEQKYEVQAEQSVPLLKALHILTRDGKMNQDSRRKLKQIYHLYHFIMPLLQKQIDAQGFVNLVDHGAGKSYLGFILYDLFFKAAALSGKNLGHIYGIESRDDLVARSQALAKEFGFSSGMSFYHQTVAQAMHSSELPVQIDVVTALHACNTATDDAIAFALQRKASSLVLVPCCQAEVALFLRDQKAKQPRTPLAELWRHPIHTREFGSQLTNVLRCLQLEAHGYKVTVTELVGWEHSMKNELIIANFTGKPKHDAAMRLKQVLDETGLQGLTERFFTQPATNS